ncbi:MAG: hypothetical protein IPL59_00105 [Candidatus Competibacteraceae bacterium]|uniref:hypothetical protein n=1 Tax=Candidatus Contendibacter odensensis TaxID=1400860 RepID=UPI0012B68C2C|nr:hypothetical protein [Candidatus Contendobacter odensis]MBK8533636.1 hypothetical protein [Candidatus Competibacteraceae bacterium]MBK8754010.1 hypothetical protein [Candidatus Competibacteraceae bacterium]
MAITKITRGVFLIPILVASHHSGARLFAPDDGGTRTVPMPSGMVRPTQGKLWTAMQPMAPNP